MLIVNAIMPENFLYFLSYVMTGRQLGATTSFLLKSHKIHFHSMFYASFLTEVIRRHFEILARPAVRAGPRGRPPGGCMLACVVRVCRCHAWKWASRTLITCVIYSCCLSGVLCSYQGIGFLKSIILGNGLPLEFGRNKFLVQVKMASLCDKKTSICFSSQPASPGICLAEEEI